MFHSLTALQRHLTPFAFPRAADQEAVQMLQRFSQVGEFYVLSKPGVPPKVDQMGFMDVLIFDEESDRHVKITYRQALLATGAVTVSTDGDVAAKGAPFAGTTVMSGGTTLADWADAATILLKANETPLANPNAVKDVVDAVDAPVVIARPFIEHAMLSAVLAVSGTDTGATIFGPSDMQISVRLRPLTHRIPAPHTIWNTIRWWNDMDFSPSIVLCLLFCRPTPL